MRGRSTGPAPAIRIGLIADTHLLADPRDRATGGRRPRLTVAGVDLPAAVFRAFAGVDRIFHAGDVYDAATLDRLAAIAPVDCARGSEAASLAGDARVQDAHRFEIGGLRVGLIHALDYPIPEWRPLDRVMAAHFGGPVDAIVFGDSHVAAVDRVNGVLLVNPGSPTLPGGLMGLGTVGILRIDGGKVSAEILDLASLERSATGEEVER